MEEIFSIIMPVYNAGMTLNDSVQSVLKQSFGDFRLYIVDDCSTDNTKDIISSYFDSRIICMKTERNSGVAEARNKAIEIANGKYIAFIDSDDIWREDKLEKQYCYFNKNYDVVCSNYETFFSSVDLDLGVSRVSPEKITYKDMLKSNFIGNLTGAYNTEKLGKFYQKKIGHEDYVMWLNIMQKSQFAYCIQENLAYYRVSPTSLSGNKFRSMLWQWNVYRNEINLSLIASCYFFLCYVFYALQKRKN
ncbi:glycosyltransferase family 2 protein [Pectobacterium sp. CHL-2024]|uniref:glycosyltransferase family 2 protein n=1 Tax=Pectobacterium sp. CHL-2024 TaxID=3377079 RepID=UPI0037FF8DFA